MHAELTRLRSDVPNFERSIVTSRNNLVGVAHEFCGQNFSAMTRQRVLVIKTKHDVSVDFNISFCRYTDKVSDNFGHVFLPFKVN